jgi:hypothetical protein
MKRNPLWLLGPVLAVALIAAGCGGGGGDDSTSTSNLAKPAWIAKADAICQQGNQEIEQAANEQFGKQAQKPTDEQIQQFTTETAVPSVQSQIDQIRDLGAPSGDEDQVNEILDTVQADIDKAKSATTLPDDPFADGNALATQYGLKVCGQS